MPPPPPGHFLRAAGRGPAEQRSPSPPSAPGPGAAGMSAASTAEPGAAPRAPFAAASIGSGAPARCRGVPRRGRWVGGGRGVPAGRAVTDRPCTQGPSAEQQQQQQEEEGGEEEGEDGGGGARPWAAPEKLLHEARLRAKAKRRLRRTSSRDSAREPPAEEPGAEPGSPKGRAHDRRSRGGKGRGLPKKGERGAAPQPPPGARRAPRLSPSCARCRRRGGQRRVGGPRRGVRLPGARRPRPQLRRSGAGTARSRPAPTPRPPTAGAPPEPPVRPRRGTRSMPPWCPNWRRTSWSRTCSPWCWSTSSTGTPARSWCVRGEGASGGGGVRGAEPLRRGRGP